MQTQSAGHMVNQVTFEGYVVRTWTHGLDRFLRLANHRPTDQGGPIPQSNMIYSDYTTVRLDPSIECDVKRCRSGTRIVVRGRIEGRDIPEMLGEILMHCNLNLQLPTNIANIVVTRPITQIYAVTLDIQQWHPDVRSGRRDGRNGRRQQRSEDRRSFPVQVLPATKQPQAAAQATALAAAPVPEPGQDLADLVTEGEAGNKADAALKIVKVKGMKGAAKKSDDKTIKSKKK